MKMPDGWRSFPDHATKVMVYEDPAELSYIGRVEFYEDYTVGVRFVKEAKSSRKDILGKRLDSHKIHGSGNIYFPIPYGTKDFFSKLKENLNDYSLLLISDKIGEKLFSESRIGTEVEVAAGIKEHWSRFGGNSMINFSDNAKQNELNKLTKDTLILFKKRGQDLLNEYRKQYLPTPLTTEEKEKTIDKKKEN